MLGLPPESIVELTQKVREELPKPTKRKNPYRYVGNTEMSGLPFPCSGYGCRNKSLKDAAFFAAMYADEVTLFNPFSSPAYISDDYDRFITECALYFSTLIAMHPLIERDIITFSDIHSYELCPNCVKKGLRAAIPKKRSQDVYDMHLRIARAYLDNSKVIYRGRSGGKHSFTIETDSTYAGHEVYIASRKSIPRGVGRLKKGESPSRDQLIELEFANRPSQYLSNDIIDTSVTADKYGINNISSSTQQIDIIRNIFESRNEAVNIDITYPFLSQARLKDVLKFRDQE